MTPAPAARFGIIAGTGFYDLPGLAGPAAAPAPVSNRWGTATLRTGVWHGQPIAFLPRHGGSHSIPPSAVNYRANVQALADCGVEAVLAVNVVGSMLPHRPTGSLLVLDDYLEFTSGRDCTFFDQPDDAGVTHTDMTTPYHPDVRAALLAAADDVGLDVEPTATYVCANGPRFETPAEIRMYAQLGGSVVGMTGYPEVALARELGLRYAAVAVVSNMAAGMSDGEISHDEITGMLDAAKEPLFALLGRAVELLAAAVPPV
ncbi:MAG TPA: S-methyl-5'-thioadenosine phosphorylase [Acidimicrobiaceae bacterium]|nr:S-methyl-5'-thioadenosine phosphorylase [Acidimicrobiaceae bacterium]